MSETKETKTSRKGIVIVFGIICIILIAGLGGTLAVYISSLNTEISQLNSNVTNLQKQITSDNTTINSLTSNVTNLEKQLNSILNGSSFGWDIIMSDPSAWVNRAVMVEGVFTLIASWVNAENLPSASPYNSTCAELLISGNRTIEVDMGASVNATAVWNLGVNRSVRIYGVFEKGETTVLIPNYYNGLSIPPGTTYYYIEAETVEPL